MSQRICNSKSEPYWWKPDWHPKHMKDIQRQASRPQYEADTFMTGIAMFLRAKMLGQDKRELSRRGRVEQKMQSVGRRRGGRGA